MNTLQLPQISRSEWPRHPNFPSQVLLLGSHANFRSVSRRLVDHIEAGGDPNYALSVFSMWKRAMGSHEAYEERKLYPYLAERWGVDFEAAEEGHEELHRHDASVREAFESGVGILEALRAHDEVLVEHLRLEEDMVIPLLLALTPSEFERYYNGRH